MVVRSQKPQKSYEEMALCLPLLHSSIFLTWPFSTRAYSYLEQGRTPVDILENMVIRGNRAIMTY